MIPEWVSCFIYTCTENVRSIFDDIRRLDWYEMLRCGTVQIVPNCLPDVYFIIYLMFTLSSHYITLPRSYSIIEHVTSSHFMSCDDHVTHREDLSYSNNVLDDRWSTIAVKLGWIPRNFKTFIFKPNLSLLRKNYKNDNKGEFLDFYEFILYMIRPIFLKKVIISDNSYFREKIFQIIFRMNSKKSKKLTCCDFHSKMTIQT